MAAGAVYWELYTENYISIIHIGVRGFPNGIFNPWARWITGLALARNSSAVAVAVDVVVVALPKCGTCTNKILDESYLEQRWGIVKHVILKGISLRF